MHWNRSDTFILMNVNVSDPGYHSACKFSSTLRTYSCMVAPTITYIIRCGHMVTFQVSTFIHDNGGGGCFSILVLHLGIPGAHGFVITLPKPPFYLVPPPPPVPPSPTNNPTPTSTTNPNYNPSGCRVILSFGINTGPWRAIPLDQGSPVWGGGHLQK